MALSRLGAVVGGLLMSRGGRRFAGRHAGKLALATLAWELYQQHRSNRATPSGQRQPPSGNRTPHPRQRWSGRRA